MTLVGIFYLPWCRIILLTTQDPPNLSAFLTKSYKKIVQDAPAATAHFDDLYLFVSNALQPHVNKIVHISVLTVILFNHAESDAGKGHVQLPSTGSQLHDMSPKCVTISEYFMFAHIS